MSQSQTGQQATTAASPQTTQDQQPAAKSSWGRTLALTGVALFVAGLFMGGLFKDSPAGTVIVKVVSFGGLGCLALGLIGVGLDALKKKSAGKSN